MKELKKYPGYYVNEIGEVYSSHSKRILKGNNSYGYMRVVIPDRTSVGIHRLVAEAFIPNPLNLPEVNHINRVRNDNRVENLEWVTHQRNSEHRSAKHYIVEHIESGDATVIYNLNKWCKEMGVTHSGLYRTLTGERKSAQGWRAYQLSHLLRLEPKCVLMVSVAACLGSLS